jgi:predicted AlkP superfamily pyrophosphatase or phosphodiesterase
LIGSLAHRELRFLSGDQQPEALYHSGVYHNRASPRSLLEELNTRFGFYPSGGDTYALDHGWITESDFLTQVERRARWTAEVTAWLYRTYQPDLLFAWQEPFDSAGHTFLLLDPRQQSYSSERARQYAVYYRQAARIADQALAITLAAVDLDRTVVLLASDHGMAPAHTRVYLNTLLQQNGLLVLDQKDYVVVEKSRAIAVASGGAANIYLNIQGREGDGLVHRRSPALQAGVAAVGLSTRRPASRC